MSNQCLRSDQVIQRRNLAYMLLKLIAAHPDTFVAKIKNVPAGWYNTNLRISAIEAAQAGQGLFLSHLDIKF